MNYRKIWESHHGPIPKDENGRTYDIHHIDGNRKNNHINNLLCVTLEDHYKIHLKQFEETKSEKEFRSLIFLSSRLNKPVDNLTGWTVSNETKEKIRKTLTGTKRPEHVIKKYQEKLKGFKWKPEDLESRRAGLIKYHENMTPEFKDKWRLKISESHKGKQLSSDTKDKLSKINSKLSDSDVLLIHDLILSGERYKIISERFNISQAQITSIKQHKTYKWLWN
jgi:hypothetical protein